MVIRQAVVTLLVVSQIQVILGQLKDSKEEVVTVNSSRFANGPLRCSCSPSKRGFRMATLNLLKGGIAEIKQEVKQVDIFDAESTAALVAGTLERTMCTCFKRDGAEACINADAVLRDRKTYYCMYDRKTGKNLYFKSPKIEETTVVTVASCDTNNDTRSKDEKVGEHKRTSHKEKVPTRKPLNQGCVAVEHLKDYTLQHRHHLNRSVLCSNGFCATPDHAIIVDGKWTSMKQLCGGGGSTAWNCTEDMKLVNNLKVLARTRARVNDHIVITPYDARFPRIVIWIVQTLEDIVHLIIQAISLGIAIILGLLMYNAAENFVAEGEEEEANSNDTTNEDTLSLQADDHHMPMETPKSFKDKARIFLKKCGVQPKPKPIEDSVSQNNIGDAKKREPLLPRNHEVVKPTSRPDIHVIRPVTNTVGTNPAKASFSGASALKAMLPETIPPRFVPAPTVPITSLGTVPVVRSAEVEPKPVPVAPAQTYTGQSSAVRMIKEPVKEPVRHVDDLAGVKKEASVIVPQANVVPSEKKSIAESMDLD